MKLIRGNLNNDAAYIKDIVDHNSHADNHWDPRDKHAVHGQMYLKRHYNACRRRWRNFAVNTVAPFASARKCRNSPNDNVYSDVWP